MKQQVMEKVTYGLILASIISAFVVVLDLHPIFFLMAFFGEIAAIVGYFVATEEETIERLYYLFVSSTAVLLGYSIGGVAAYGAMNTIMLATAITALVVGGVYYYTLNNRVNTEALARSLFPISLGFMFVLVIGIFISFGTVGDLLVALFGAGLFSLYLLFDLGRLENKQYVSPARMAWSVYWDVLLIFQFLLDFLFQLDRN